jgi:hypothetical protein
MKKTTLFLAVITVISSCKKLPNYDDGTNPKPIDWSENSLPKLSGKYIFDSLFVTSQGWSKNKENWNTYYIFSKDTVTQLRYRVIDSVEYYYSKHNNASKDNGEYVQWDYAYKYTKNDSSVRLIDIGKGHHNIYLRKIK